MKTKSFTRQFLIFVNDEIDSEALCQMPYEVRNSLHVTKKRCLVIDEIKYKYT